MSKKLTTQELKIKLRDLIWKNSSLGKIDLLTSRYLNEKMNISKFKFEKLISSLKADKIIKQVYFRFSIYVHNDEEAPKIIKKFESKFNKSSYFGQDLILLFSFLSTMYLFMILSYFDLLYFFISENNDILILNFVVLGSLVMILIYMILDSIISFFTFIEKQKILLIISFLVIILLTVISVFFIDLNPILQIIISLATIFTLIYNISKKIRFK